MQRQGEAVELTSTEFDLLHLLAREPGKVFSRDDILNQLRGHEAELYTRAVDIVVSRLRKKLEPLDGHQDPAQRRLCAGAACRRERRACLKRHRGGALARAARTGGCAIR